MMAVFHPVDPGNTQISPVGSQQLKKLVLTVWATSMTVESDIGHPVMLIGLERFGTGLQE